MMNNILPATAGKPFIKWVGGKRQLLSVIGQAMPTGFDKVHTYVEPFTGGGAVFFWLRQLFPDKRYVLNDYNADLINTYHVLRDQPDKLIGLLRELKQAYGALPDVGSCKDFYLRQRERYNSDSPDSMERAALLIFLNKTCFNGLYRVNRAGKFNVPYGRFKDKTIYDEATIRQDSRLLQGVVLMSGDYARCGEYAMPGSFFYLDPPYRPIKETSCFTSYTKDGFGDDCQRQLKEFCDRLTDAGAGWMQSNSDGTCGNPPNNFLDKLYESYYISRVPAARSINRGEKNNGVTNYQLRPYFPVVGNNARRGRALFVRKVSRKLCGVITGYL